MRADEATALQGDPKQEMFIAGLSLGQPSWDESFSHRKMHPSPIKFLKNYDSSENPSGRLVLIFFLSFYQLTFFLCEISHIRSTVLKGTIQWCLLHSQCFV